MPIFGFGTKIETWYVNGEMKSSSKTANVIINNKKDK